MRFSIITYAFVVICFVANHASAAMDSRNFNATDLNALSCARPLSQPLKTPKLKLPFTSVHGAPLSDIPSSWDWRDHAYLSQMGNQHLPQWCGSCWAHATTAMLTDRFRIHAPKAMQHTRLSLQALLNCGVEFNIGTCSGGSWERALNFMYNYYLTDETCLPNMSVDRSVNSLTTCLDHMCRDCDVYSNCKSVQDYKRYYIANWGYVRGAANMLNELYHRGPLVCYMFSHTPQYLNYTGGIIDDNTALKPDQITHVVEIVGYGTAEGKDYWIVRNSFGTRWGENGFFRIVRGKNQLNMESNCGWAIPQLRDDPL